MKPEELHIKENSLIARLAARKLGTADVAIVIGKTIYLYGAGKEDFLKNERWVKHECCHLRQYEKHGLIGFIIKYIIESLRNGYHNNKFEVEAREAELM